MIFHENRLPADDSHEISCLIVFFEKSANLKLSSAAKIIGGALWVNMYIEIRKFAAFNRNSLMSSHRDK